MPDIKQAGTALVKRILEGTGMTEAVKREAAFNNSGLAGAVDALVDKVARYAFRVTDEDIAAATASGLNEDEVFEIVVCAAVGQATREYHRHFRHLRPRREGISMRLRILDSGHGFGTKTLFALIRTLSRQPVLDVVKLVKYRTDFYGEPMSDVTQKSMRGPSTWSVGDRELMAAYIAQTNQSNSV